MVNFGVLPDEEPFESPTIYTMPTRIDPFDPAPLIALFDRYKIEIFAMETMAMSLKVSDDATANQAAEYTTQARKLASVLDKKRQEEKAPYLAVTSVLDKHVKGLTDALAGVQRIVNGKLQPYLQKKEQERIEAQRKAEAEARAVQARLEAEEAEKRRQAEEAARLEALKNGADQREAEEAAKVAAAMVEPAPVVVAQAMPDETKTSTESGTVALKKEWAFTIEDFRSLPDQCLIDRQEEINKAVAPWIRKQIAAGLRNIPGVRVFEQSIIKTRTK